MSHLPRLTHGAAVNDPERLPTGAEKAKIEIWVRSHPDSRQLELWYSSQSLSLSGDGYWPHTVDISHATDYAAVDAFAARSSVEGRDPEQTKGRWTHFLAAPIILREQPWYELPVGVAIMRIHAPTWAASYVSEVAGHVYYERLVQRLTAKGVELLSVGL